MYNQDGDSEGTGLHGPGSDLGELFLSQRLPSQGTRRTAGFRMHGGSQPHGRKGHPGEGGSLDALQPESALLLPHRTLSQVTPGASLSLHQREIYQHTSDGSRRAPAMAMANLKNAKLYKESLENLSAN